MSADAEWGNLERVVSDFEVVLKGLRFPEENVKRVFERLHRTFDEVTSAPEPEVESGLVEEDFMA